MKTRVLIARILLRLSHLRLRHSVREASHKPATPAHKVGILSFLMNLMSESDTQNTETRGLFYTDCAGRLSNAIGTTGHVIVKTIRPNGVVHTKRWRIKKRRLRSN